MFSEVREVEKSFERSKKKNKKKNKQKKQKKKKKKNRGFWEPKKYSLCLSRSVTMNRA